MAQNRMFQGSGIKRQKFNFGGKSSRQTPQEVYNIAVAREMAQKPFNIEKEERDIATSGRTKAVGEAVTAIGSLKKILPVLDEFETEFKRIFPNASTQTGFRGKFESAKAVIKAKMETDPDFSAAVDQLLGKRSQITKGLGEVGNLAEQEQTIAMQNVPEMKFQGIQDFFLPEAPATSESKLSKFREFIRVQMLQNLGIINSGGDMSTLLPSSPVPGMPGFKNKNGGIEQERQKAIAAIQSGKDAKKVADIFRSRTGQELNG